MLDAPHTAALIVAAGRGVRAGAGSLPKQYQLVGGSTDSGAHPGDLPRPPRHRPRPGRDRRRRCGRLPVCRAAPRQAAGAGDGRRRAARIRSAAGLPRSPQAQPARVLIHDAARPFASADLIGRVAAALATADAVVPAVPVASTLKRVDADGRVTATVPRDRSAGGADAAGLRLRCDPRRPRRRRAEAAQAFTDDAAVAEWAGMPVVARARRGRQRQAHHAAGHRGRRSPPHRRGGAGARRRPGRHRLRRPRLRPRRRGHARRRRDPAYARARRPFRRRRGAARADRRGARRTSPTATSASISRPPIRNGRAPRPTASCADAAARVASARRPHRPSRCRDRHRGPQDRPASRGHPRTASPRSPASRSTASASRRRPPRASASSAGARASRPTRSPPSACHSGDAHDRPRPPSHRPPRR